MEFSDWVTEEKTCTVLQVSCGLGLALSAMAQMAVASLLLKVTSNFMGLHAWCSFNNGGVAEEPMSAEWHWAYDIQEYRLPVASTACAHCLQDG